MPLPPDFSQLEDEDLLAQALAAREGDLRAFEELVLRHQNRILANCRYLTRDQGVSEDLAQEVFVKAFFGLPGFESRSSFRHWLQRIKVNHCLNHIKKQQSHGYSVGLDEEGTEGRAELRVAPAAEQELEEEATRRKVEAILNAMPATLRVPLIMCDMDDLSYEEIAGSLGIGLSAVKMRIKRAREQFRTLYEAVEGQGRS
ncbi:MAG: sigma-70 family RNA polymerase sigma factor [Bryobacterales bacterium]|nr:sigma-70 family RNA polymerase sigma factor [Bryobacterales bacterium]